MIEVVFPWPPKELNPNSRNHWAKRAKAAKKYRRECWALARAAGIKVEWSGDIHLWITFLPPDRRHRDDDNIIASFKSGRDGLADAIGVNDNLFRAHPFVSRKTGGKVIVFLSQHPGCRAI